MAGLPGGSTRQPQEAFAEQEEVEVRSALLIPARLCIDRCPVAMCDCSDPVRVVDQEPPCFRASRDHRVVIIPDEMAEFIAAQVVPDIFHEIQLGRIRWQRQQGYVVRHLQFAAAPVPTRAVAHQNGMRPGYDRSGREPGYPGPPAPIPTCG